jgi:hypothetical protein
MIPLRGPRGDSDNPYTIIFLVSGIGTHSDTYHMKYEDGYAGYLTDQN